MKEPANVLVVDDNPDLLNTFALILKRKGYKVDTASDGLSAVTKVKERHFDVILMDIIMPRMDGIEAFRLIREIDPRARVILMTAYYEEDKISEALNQGVFSAIHKPVDIARLIDLIGEASSSPLILIVDDDDNFRRTMARILGLRGFRVITAASAEEAVRAARERPCKLAFIDIKMPCINGLQACTKLKEIDPDIVAVMMTGYRSEVSGIVAEAMASQAATCLYKPFDFVQVMELISQFCTPEETHAAPGKHFTR